jgi:hypothetical protein
MSKEMLVYEDTLKDIEKTFGAVPGLMKLFPEEKLVHDWPSWKSMGEIDMERVPFLLSTDKMIEEMLGENQGNSVPLSTKPDVAAEVAQEDSA